MCENMHAARVKLAFRLLMASKDARELAGPAQAQEFSEGCVSLSTAVLAHECALICEREELESNTDRV